MTKNILQYFPYDEPRPSQIKALDWIENNNAKYLLLQAPVGSGKSAIGLTYSRFLAPDHGNSYILTPQRILQEQYERSFVDGNLSSLYGKSNYKCRDKNTTCDVGSVLKQHKCEFCPYRSAFHKAKGAPNTIFNYKLALSLFGYTDAFLPKDKRALCVLDECHTVEQHLTEFGAVEVYHKRAEKFGIKNWPSVGSLNLYTAQEWVRETYVPAVERQLRSLFHDVEPLTHRDPETLSRFELKLIREYDNLKKHIKDHILFTAVEREELEKDYVLVFDKNMFKFKQVTGAKNFKWLLEPAANRFLFMSSTILDKDGFCQDLGLPANETDFLSLDSDFPIENREVFYIPHTKMNVTWSDDNRANDRKKMIDGIKTLLNMHEGENGIIHTGSFKIAKWLVEELELWPKLKHEVVHHNPDSPDDRNTMISYFQKNKDPSLLISPSITEGLDLKDDLGRFAIFAKIPYPFLGDQWVKRRQQMSPEWYLRQTIIGVIQGGGRVVRSIDDWGTVYILDASFTFLKYKTEHQLPKWWLDGLTYV